MNYNLRSLQALEAVYRHRSVAHAATELNVTASAISHQLRNLSANVGERLVQKSGRGVELTEAGQRLAESLHVAFQQIKLSMEESVGRTKKVLRLAVCSSFGPGWLIKRLADLQANRSIDVQLRMYAQHPQLTDSVADAFVTAYPLEYGYVSTPLFDEVLVAVHAPDFSVMDHPLITTSIDAHDFANDWRQFGSAAAIDFPQLSSSKVMQCTHYLLAMEMACHGLGAALVGDFLAEEHLRAGRIERMHSVSLQSGRRYHLCYKSARKSDPALLELHRWFKHQIGMTNS